MAYKRVSSGGSTYPKWDKPGQTFEGKISGFPEPRLYPPGPQGKLTYQVSIRQMDGTEVTLRVLASIKKIRDYPIGTQVKLTYIGPKVKANGNTEKSIEMEVDEDAAPLPISGGSTAVAPPSTTVAPTTAADEYDVLLCELQLKNPKGAAAVKTALEAMTTDPAERLAKLQQFMSKTVWDVVR